MNRLGPLVCALAFLALPQAVRAADSGPQGRPVYGPMPQSTPESGVMKPLDVIDRLYESPGIVRSLMALEAEGKTTDIMAAVRGVTDGQQMKSALLWLRGRVMADDLPDPRYALLYAEALLRVIGAASEDNEPLMETAAMVYLYGRLALGADAQRCVNRDEAQREAEALTANDRGLIAFYRALPSEKRRDILGVAMRLEERIVNRKPSDYICKPKSASDPSGPEGTVKDSAYTEVEKELFSLMDDLEMDPRFVSRRIWMKRRETLREDFAREFR